MRFNDFKFIVLCNEKFDAGFITKLDAIGYINRMKTRYPNCVFTIYEVDNGDERELDRIWINYKELEDEIER